MYKVNGMEFKSFSEAIAFAKKNNAEVYEISTGLRRWHPAPPVSAKKKREHQNRLNAYKAYSE